MKTKQPEDTSLAAYLVYREVVPGFTDRRGVFRPTAATWAIREVLSRVQCAVAPYGCFDCRSISIDIY